MPTIKLALFYDGKLDLRALWLMPFPLDYRRPRQELNAGINQKGETWSTGDGRLERQFGGALEGAS